MQGRRRQFCVVSIIFPPNSKFKTYQAEIGPMIVFEPDAPILANPSSIDMVRDVWSEMPIHRSVQANALNDATDRMRYRGVIWLKAQIQVNRLTL